MMLAEVYCKVLVESCESQVDFLVKVANDALGVAEWGKGSFSADLVEFYVLDVFRGARIKELPENESESVRVFVDRYLEEDKLDEVKEICLRVMGGESFGVDLLISVLCSFKSYRALFGFIEKQFDAIVDSSINSVYILNQILKLVDTFLLFQHYEIDKKHYYVELFDFYSIHKNIFNTLWNVIVKISETELIPNLIKILPKFWIIFKDQRIKIFPKIVEVLKFIQSSENNENSSIAQKFLYVLFTDPSIESSMKGLLKSEFLLLFNGMNFKYSVIPAVSKNELKIPEMFPLMLNLSPGERFELKIPVIQNSILYIDFILQSHDINFSIHSSKSTIFSLKSVKSGSPHCVKMIVSDSDVLVLEWDNSYSWMQEKRIRYKVLLLRPYEPEVIEPIYALSFSQNLLLVYRDRVEKFEGIENCRGFLEDFIESEQKGRIFLLDFNEQKRTELGKVRIASGMREIETCTLLYSEKTGVKNILAFTNSPCLQFCVLKNGKIVKVNKVLEKIDSFNKKSFENVVFRISKYFKGSLIILVNIKNQQEASERLTQLGSSHKCININPNDLYTSR